MNDIENAWADAGSSPPPTPGIGREQLPRLPNHQEAAKLLGREAHRILQYIKDGQLDAYLTTNENGMDTWRIYPESIVRLKADLDVALALTHPAHSLEGCRRRAGRPKKSRKRTGSRDQLFTKLKDSPTRQIVVTWGEDFPRRQIRTYQKKKVIDCCIFNERERNGAQQLIHDFLAYEVSREECETTSPRGCIGRGVRLTLGLIADAPEAKQKPLRAIQEQEQELQRQAAIWAQLAEWQKSEVYWRDETKNKASQAGRQLNAYNFGNVTRGTTNADGKFSNYF